MKPCPLWGYGDSRFGHGVSRRRTDVHPPLTVLSLANTGLCSRCSGLNRGLPGFTVVSAGLHRKCTVANSRKTGTDSNKIYCNSSPNRVWSLALPGRFECTCFSSRIFLVHPGPPATNYRDPAVRTGTYTGEYIGAYTGKKICNLFFY